MVVDEFVQTPAVMVIIYEANYGLREIFTDGRKLPAGDVENWWYGYSVGHWDGDAFVVETAGFNDQSWLDGLGLPHSEDLRVTKSFKFKDRYELRLIGEGFNILNIGRGIAKHVGFLVEVIGANVLNASQPLQNVSGLNPGHQFCQYSNDVNVIHPNSIRTQIGSFVAAPTLDDNFRLVFQVYCEHMPSKRIEFTITLKARDPVNPIL